MFSFTYYNPTKIHFGKGMTRMLGKELKDAGIHKVLLVAGKNSIKQNGVYDEVINSLASFGIILVEGWGVRSNPELDKVKELIDIAKRESIEAIVAVGGGSVIDTAKAVAAGFYLNDIWNVFIRKESIKLALPVYTVLTISGTGSEMNGNAVITNMSEAKKWGIASPLLYPKVSIIDPSHQNSLPFRLTVSGAIDAISHILEFYYADSAPEATLAINDALLKTIMTSTDLLQTDSGNITARANLAWSASLALNGMSGLGLNGGDWACHQIEHSISAINPNVSHGEGLGVIFPTWIQYMSEKDPNPFLRWSNNIWKEEIPANAVRRFRDKIAAWGSAVTLRELGIKEDELTKIVDNIMQFPTIGAISKFSRRDIECLIMLAW